jgi:eukaryotic-like serine/threonine-protein kinase
MNCNRRKEIERVFEAALDQPAPARRRWVSDVCGGDEDLRASVLRLLRAHQRAEGILDHSAAAASGLREPDAEHVAERRIGAYRLVREVGRGGMSIVYLAERDDRQYRQTVAVKVIRRGLDTPDLVQRFLAERQILASLSHPNIARLLDGGTTADGLPYLVMEYVDGEPLTDYCDRRRLTVEQRLQLFVAISRTVHHAHRNLIVHRDLKPSNILVTGDGEIRLLDFGIAKLLDPHHFPSALPQTGPELRLMTPAYASPEQLRGEPVTTAADVYGLGVVLCELLTGEHPSRRQTRGARPRGRRRGDLDRIVTVALREEPERRYPSAEQLAEDVEYYLARRPIRARGDSLPYRLGRFATRHRWGVAAAAAFVLLLVGYAATLTIKEREVRAALEHASLEAERSEQVTAFLLRLFEATDPDEVGSDAITASQLLERGAARAEQFAHEPAAQAQMLDVIGRTWQHLGRYERAQPLLERALALRRGIFGDANAVVAESLHHLARLHHARGELDAAEALFRQALHTQRQLRGDEHVQAARVLAGLAVVHRDRGEHAHAESLGREVLEMRRRILGEEHPEVAESLHALAEVLRRDGRYTDARPLFRQALALRERLLGDGHPAVAETLYSLAVLLQQHGDVSEVESLYRRALAIYRTSFGTEHPAIAAATSNLGLLMFRQGDLEAADSLYRQALAMRRNVLGAEHPDVAVSLGLLAAVQRRKGELAEAEALYRESLAMQRRLFGGEHPDIGHGMNGLALVLRDRGDYAAADSLYEEVLAMRLRLLGERHPSVATTLNDRGVLMREWGRYTRAESLLLQALELRREMLHEGHRQIEQSLHNLATLYERWERPLEAAAFREPALRVSDCCR